MINSSGNVSHVYLKLQKVPTSSSLVSVATRLTGFGKLPWRVLCAVNGWWWAQGGQFQSTELAEDNF